MHGEQLGVKPERGFRVSLGGALRLTNVSQDVPWLLRAQETKVHSNHSAILDLQVPHSCFCEQ